MRIKRLFLLFALLLVSSTAQAQIKDAASLQAAVNAAAASSTGGDIALEPGATYTGNFVLPARASTSTVTIRSAGTLPEGRYGPPSPLPKLISPNADPVIRTAPRASGYRLVGLEITTTAAIVYDLVRLGEWNVSDVALQPSNITIDRCYIHGTATGDSQRGVALNGANLTVINSYISDIHFRGADSQALCGWNGPGPFVIENNYLEAAGENIMFGGADAKIPNLVPSNITIRRNHFFKPLSWSPFDKASFKPLGGQVVTWTISPMPGPNEDPSQRFLPRYVDAAGNTAKRWAVKNLFELKNARRVVVDGNKFENNWGDGQIGYAILLTPRNQDGSNPWSVVEDVTFTNAWIVNSPHGLQVLGRDYLKPSQLTARIKIDNILFEKTGGRWLTITQGGSAITINRVTVPGKMSHITVLADGQVSGFSLTNSIFGLSDNGMLGDSTAEGTATINRYLPGANVSGNVFVGRVERLYPPNNRFPPDIASVGFVDPSTGNYRLKPDSPYRSAGADIDAILAAMNPPAPAPPAPPAPPTKASVVITLTVERERAAALAELLKSLMPGAAVEVKQ